jgi:hypothetical protein
MPPDRRANLSEEQTEDLGFWWKRIRPGDQVLWTGRASGGPARDRVFLYIIAAGVALVAGGGIVILRDASAGTGQWMILIGLVVPPFLLHSRRSAYDDARYALTERCAMVWNGQVLRVWPYRPGLVRTLRRGRPAAIVFTMHPDSFDDEGPQVDELGGFMGLDAIVGPLEILALKNALPADWRARPSAPEPELPGDPA